MLIKIFELNDSVKNTSLSEAIKVAVSDLGFNPEQVRTRFSDLSLMKGRNKIRVLVTGLDANGRERRIVLAVGNVCHEHYKIAGIDFPGFSNPALPNQK